MPDVSPTFWREVAVVVGDLGRISIETILPQANIHSQLLGLQLENRRLNYPAIQKPYLLLISKPSDSHRMLHSHWCLYVLRGKPARCFGYRKDRNARGFDLNSADPSEAASSVDEKCESCY